MIRAVLTIAAGAARERAKALPPSDGPDLRVEGAMVMSGSQCIVEAASEGEAERAVAGIRELWDDARAEALWDLGDHLDALRDGGLDKHDAPPAPPRARPGTCVDCGTVHGVDCATSRCADCAREARAHGGLPAGERGGA